VHFADIDARGSILHSILGIFKFLPDGSWLSHNFCNWWPTQFQAKAISENMLKTFQIDHAFHIYVWLLTDENTKHRNY